ncbi:class I SAM-dependent methyltransferase [Sneathiella sp. HT1-7]|uniref:class I SAM-dependent methyltransferase n=1 Tax=Sneathiella sp. HT1-7 TaxID=2887192 RepID=UPI001D158500|nr:class I SAM-dependent methyltransferase [Sneathiella sp. HT1-7]MCC3303730.1 class I SAM-dependent methyltransferase [Sneathiella sp. HT1-7]
MSRLESFIRRISAQRDCLNHAAAIIEDKPGSVLELGLGNGRTFDHLRSLMPERDIYVFDRHVKAHPDCIPDSDHMIVGNFLETVPTALEKMTDKAVLAHCDIGSGDKAASVALARMLGESLPKLLVTGAIIVSDQPFEVPSWQSLRLPEGVAEGRYHIYRQM